jgi:hypothetical protein
MPYTDPAAKKAYDLAYKSARRAKLAAQEKERVARLKDADPEGWRAMVVERSRQFRVRHGDSPEYREQCRAQGRKHWAKIKDDPAVKAANVARVQAWYQANTGRAKTNSRRAHKARLLFDLPYKIGFALHRRMAEALKGKKKPSTSSAVHDLGCSLSNLVSYLEARFQPDMSWKNWGRKGWHIDHVKPLKAFDLTNPTEYAAACHYTNLQPLWAADNIAKDRGDRPWPYLPRKT